LQSPMRFKPPNCMRLQGAAEERRRAFRRPFVLQVPSRCGAPRTHTKTRTPEQDDDTKTDP